MRDLLIYACGALAPIETRHRETNQGVKAVQQPPLVVVELARVFQLVPHHAELNVVRGMLENIDPVRAEQVLAAKRVRKACAHRASGRLVRPVPGTQVDAPLPD